MVGIDGSDGYRPALARAARRAELTGTRLYAVTVAAHVSIPHPLSEIIPRSWYLEQPDVWVQPRPTWPTWQAGARSMLEGSVNDVIGVHLRDLVRLDVLEGHPAGCSRRSLAGPRWSSWEVAATAVLQVCCWGPSAST